MFFVLIWLCSFFVPTYGHHCPPDALYFEATAKCYHYINRPFPFLQAEQYCVREAKGHLVSISNAYEMIAVEDLASSGFRYGVESYWIGAKLVGNRPQWTNGNKFAYSNWKNGHPPHHLPNSCIQASAADGGWSAAKCENPNYFICESRANRFRHHGGRVLTYRCDPGWQLLPSSRSCYKVIHNVNWHSGESQCKREGAHLTSIHSQEENDFVNRLTNAGKCYTCQDNPWDDQMWIGLVDSNPVPSKTAKHPYVWVDGSPMDYKNWVVGEPGFPGTEFCAMSLSNVGSCCQKIYYKWGDYLCTRVMRAAVCKKPAVTS